MRQQHTIGREMTCCGVGLHSGVPVTMRMLPAPPGTGIVFVYPQGSKSVELPASVQHLHPAELCTTISAHGVSIRTVEHVLAALSGLGVDNVYLEVSAGEVPVMDGSAAPFVDLIQAAGVIPQGVPQPFVKVTQPIEVSDGGRRIVVEPSSTTRITYSIEYDHPFIRRQTHVYDWSTAGFERSIAGARTFGFLKEVKYLWSRGLGKGGSLDNTVILSDDGILNETGLRFHDEFVRHKVLDLIGDLAFLQFPIIGHITADRAGHALHTKFVAAVLSQPDKWIMVNTTDRTPASHSTPLGYVPQPASYC